MFYEDAELCEMELRVLERASKERLLLQSENVLTGIEK